MSSIALVRRSAAASLCFILALCTFTFCQTLTVLHTFHVSDGEHPDSGLIRGSDGNLYGTTVVGGSAGCGTVFKITQSGKFASIYSFLGGNDGCNPEASVIRDAAGNLYGTTVSGGPSNAGTVFKINSSGHESVVYAFTGNADGGSPNSNVVRDRKGILYGVTPVGGDLNCTAGGCGTVFKIDANGNETVLHTFTGPLNSAGDGGFPSGGLVVDSSGNLYGTTAAGGFWGEGTVFKIDPLGNETLLYSFGSLRRDGTGPAGLSFGPGGILYGTTSGGGDSSAGTIFKLDTQGNETILYSFAGLRSDGSNPSGPVARDAEGNLYGVTLSGGASLRGVVYKLDSSGTETILHNFVLGADGADPDGRLYVNSQGVVFGTTFQGGRNLGNGTVFKITP
jgi:uncharacterized repeat protein (TIGR03803 family)